MFYESVEEVWFFKSYHILSDNQRIMIPIILSCAKLYGVVSYKIINYALENNFMNFNGHFLWRCFWKNIYQFIALIKTISKVFCTIKKSTFMYCVLMYTFKYRVYYLRHLLLHSPTLGLVGIIMKEINLNFVVFLDDGRLVHTYITVATEVYHFNTHSTPVSRQSL